MGQRTVLSLTLVRANAGVALGLNPFVQRHVLAHIGGIDHDMATEIDAARLLIWRAGWMLAEGIPLARGEGSMAKLYAGDMAMRVTTEAVQVLGGYGYIKEYPVERFMRDAKVYQIWEETSEIQRLVISRCLLGERRSLGRPAPAGWGPVPPRSAPG